MKKENNGTTYLTKFMEEMSYVEYMDGIEKYIEPQEELTSFTDSIRTKTSERPKIH
jgi:hypothetical protein